MREFEREVGGNSEKLREAVRNLVEGGWVAMEQAGRSHHHRLLSPYRVGDEAPMRELPWEAE